MSKESIAMIPNTSFCLRRAKVPTLPVLCFALVVCTLALMSSAYTQTPAGTPGSAARAEIDANFFSGVTYSGAPFPSGNDWSQGPAGSALLLQSGGRSILGLNSATNSLWFRDQNWGAGKDPTQFNGGQKNDQPIDSASNGWSVVDTTFGGGSPQKNDITNCYISTQVDGATGHRWVVAGFETRSVNGSSFAGLELDQKGMFVDRRVAGSNKLIGRARGPGAVGGRIAGTVDNNGHLVGGDILMIVDYTSGGTRPVVSLREWSANKGGSWVLIADSLTAGKGFATTNMVNVPAVAPGQGVSPNGTLTDTTIALQFVEFGLDLTGLNVFPLDPCNPQATALFQTRSSSSFTSSLMDYALAKFAVIPPAVANAGPDQASCPQGDVSTFTLAGSAQNGTPLWSVLSGRVSIADPTSLTSTVTDTGTGTAMLLLTVTSSQGCGRPVDTVAITVYPNPSVSVNSPEVCASALPATLTATPSGGTGPVNFRWNTGATTQTISTSTGGTYTVTVTDAKGCSGTGSGTLTVLPNPTVTVANVDVCPGDSGTLTATASGGTGSKTFAWSTGATTPSIRTSTAGTYSVTVTDSKGCTGSGSGKLSVLTPPSVVATGGTITCLQHCVQLSASSTSPNVTYRWTGPGGFTSADPGPTVCDSGTYTVTVTDTHGCTGSATARVYNTVPPGGTCGGSGTTQSGFELDGDAMAVGSNPPDDWNLIYNGTGHQTSTTGRIADYPSKSDDYFVLGTKDMVDVSNWHYSIQSTPDKDDILDAGAAQYNTQLYFFADRYAVNGNAQIGFWFFQDTVHILPGGLFSGKHTVGDLLILSNFVGGGGTAVIFAYEWVGSGGSDGSLNALTLSGANSFAITNSTTCPAPWPYKAKSGQAGQYPIGAFFEGGIDLACLPGVNLCFSSFLIETRSSASVSAELKDFVIGSFSAGATAPAMVGQGTGPDGGQNASTPEKPAGYALHPNYPNPFNPTTQIKFDLPEESSVRLSVFNILGQEVATLAEGTIKAGYQSVEWNTANREGPAVPSGVYIYRLQASSITSGKYFYDVKKMVLLK
jgi:hypothetical protein